MPLCYAVLFILSYPILSYPFFFFFLQLALFRNITSSLHKL